MIINFDTILAISGLLFTLILGYLGLKYTLKYRKKTNLIFIKNNSISLFERVVKNLDDLEIKFKGKKIDENLILFKGTFFNIGNTDIDKSIIHKPLEIELPPSYKWVQYKFVKKSQNLNLELSQIDNKLIFDWDLMKEGEFFTFDSIIEYQSPNDNALETDKIEENLLDKIKLNHRIKDLKNIKIEKSFPQIASNYVLLFGIVLSLILMMFAASLGFQPVFNPTYKVYNELNLNSKKQFLTVSAIDKDKITLSDTLGNEIQTMSLNQAEKILKKKIKTKNEELNYYLVGMMMISIIFMIFAQVRYIFIPEIRSRKLIKKFKENNYEIEN